MTSTLQPSSILINFVHLRGIVYNRSCVSRSWSVILSRASHSTILDSLWLATEHVMDWRKRGMVSNLPNCVRILVCTWLTWIATSWLPIIVWCIRLSLSLYLKLCLMYTRCCLCEIGWLELKVNLKLFRANRFRTFVSPPL